jgi:hypothetical protein
MVVGRVLARAEPGATSEAPLGFIHLRDAADMVGRKLYGANWGSFAKRQPPIARIRVQQQLIRTNDPAGDGWWWDGCWRGDGWWRGEDWRLGDSWYWCVASPGHETQQGTADTKTAAEQEAHDAARKTGLVIDVDAAREAKLAVDAQDEARWHERMAAESDTEIENVKLTVARACEAGQIGTAYRTLLGTERLDPGVWQSRWRTFLGTWTIDIGGQPREILVRQQDLIRFVGILQPIANLPVETPAVSADTTSGDAEPAPSAVPEPSERPAPKQATAKQIEELIAGAGNEVTLDGLRALAQDKGLGPRKQVDAAYHERFPERRQRPGPRKKSARKSAKK